MTQHENDQAASAGGAGRVTLWLPGLLVAVGAAVATAHGLFEVARAAHTPAVIAGLYPLITDGLALVAYAATARLAGRGRRYAWFVVVLAAGLSGLAQASYLAHGAVSTSTALRFGIGAWPAIAAAIVAHLLFLILHAERATSVEPTPKARSDDGNGALTGEPVAAAPPEPDSAIAVTYDDGQRSDGAPTVQLEPAQPEEASSVRAEPVRPSVEAVQAKVVQPPRTRSNPVQPEPVQPQPDARAVQPPRGRAGLSPARARADRAARTYAARHGALPTATQLVEAAEVSRGTAGEVLKALRNEPLPLHIVTEHTPSEAQQ